MPKIPRSFYQRDDTLQIARELIGKTLVVPDDRGKNIAGKIVECEAYLGPEDKAAHSHNNRRTKRTEIMFSEGGVAYVFFVYGMYYQFNVVVGGQDVPHAILIRALEPVDGIETMRSRRGDMPDKNLTSGPGKLAIALGITKGLNGAHLNGERVWIENGASIPKNQIASGERIGIDYAGDFARRPWRYWLKNNPYVSR